MSMAAFSSGFMRQGTNNPQAEIAQSRLDNLKAIQREAKPDLERIESEYLYARKRFETLCAAYYELARQVEMRDALIEEAETEARARKFGLTYPSPVRMSIEDAA